MPVTAYTGPLFEDFLNGFKVMVLTNTLEGAAASR
jgi:hypothetical protein